VAYVNDIKPILDSDCIACHGSRIHENNVRLDTYANVMRVVTPGKTNSLLVLDTRPGAVMYPNLTGDRAAKSDLIRSWVVNSNAAETR
jgi:cytochrome c